MSWSVLGALAGWAVMVQSVAGSGLDAALGNRDLLAKALCEGIGGCGLLGLSLWRRERIPHRRECGALLLLAGVASAGELLKRPYIDGVLHVHYVREPFPGMLLILAPLWLALLSGLRMLPDRVPRRTVGAVLAGLAGYCLLLQEGDLTPHFAEAPALLLCFVQALATVWIWSYTRRVLTNHSVVAIAGCGLLVLAAVHGIATIMIPNDVARSFVWVRMLVPLAIAVGATAGGALLWYWLLLHAELAAFCMQPLVRYLSALIGVFALFGFLSWRVDLALVLGLGALVTSLRARVEDDELLRLDVAGAGSR